MRGTPHPIDTTYFREIDTERKAYWLGMLSADGCNKANGRVILSLSGEDRYMLEEFKRDIGFGGEIYQAKQYPRHKKIPYRLEFCNRVISDDLFRHGIVYNKSLSLRFPADNQIPLDFMPHFVRGYFDGDGHVGKTRGLLEVSVTSSPDFCVGLIRFLSSTLQIDAYLKSYKNNRAKSIQLASRKAIMFLDYIYRSKGIRMSRKFDTFASFVRDYTYRTANYGSSIDSSEYREVVERWKSDPKICQSTYSST